MTATEVATGAEGVDWDIDTLVDGEGTAGVDRLMAEALDRAEKLTVTYKTKVASSGPTELAALYDELAEIHDRIGRAASYASLRFSTDVADPERGALVQSVQERASAVSAELVWVDLEWVAVDDDAAADLMAAPELARHGHHLETERLSKPHVLSEVEEKLLANKAPTGRAAWVRLYTEQQSAIRVPVDGEEVSLDVALSNLFHPDRERRRTVAEAVTEGLKPGLRTRAYIYNTLLSDKSIDDRLRGYPTWITAWNHGNETSDESVEALVAAVVDRYDIAQRWYDLKAKVLGVDKLADYDRNASVAETDTQIGWDEAKQIVRDAYASFSDTLAAGVDRFLDEGWVDAPIRPNKRGGAFCSYTVASHHPYVFLNYTATPNDVFTLAHELGHGLHGYLAREQGIFHQATPLTVAETASVFGETVTFERVLSQTEDPGERFALLAANVEGNIATVFRQVAMNRFEDAAHNHRRDKGELSLDDFAEHWLSTQNDLFGDSLEPTEGYATWWSYIPHFIGTPGYVYAYAYGQLLALSVYARYEAEGDSFVPAYVDLLRAGGSMWPTELGKIVDCDLNDPGFWAAGLDIVDTQLRRAEEAATAAGRV